jgi:hypothetical protein
MTVRKGAAWGSEAVLPADAPVARSDAEVRGIVTDARRRGGPIPIVGLLGGDLWRTCGARTSDESTLRSEAVVLVPVDIGAVLLDGRLQWFVAHLVARRSWWRGRVVAVMNAEHLGRFDVAPRAHPGDGRFDLVDVAASMGVSQRWKAWRRAPLGTHVPHPAIGERRVTAWQERFDPPLDVWLDGARVGEVRDLSVRVEPDALTVAI